MFDTAEKGSVELEDIANETSQKWSAERKKKTLEVKKKGTDQSFGDLWDDIKWLTYV